MHFMHESVNKKIRKKWEAREELDRVWSESENEGDLKLIKPNCNTFEANPGAHSPCLEASILGLLLKYGFKRQLNCHWLSLSIIFGYLSSKFLFYFIHKCFASSVYRHYTILSASSQDPPPPNTHTDWEGQVEIYIYWYSINNSY